MAESPPNDITILVEQASAGQDHAMQRLIEIIYPELKALAAAIRRKNANPSNTINTTSLVNEAWLKIQKYGLSASSRKHFFCIMAKAMRQILINAANSKLTHKRQGIRATLDDVSAVAISEAEWLIQLEEIIAAIEAAQPRLSEVFHLKYYLNMPEEDIAQALEVTVRTVRRDWHNVKHIIHQAIA